MEAHLAAVPSTAPVTNHSGCRERTTDLTLADTADPEVARDNCFAATWAFMSAASEQQHLPTTTYHEAVIYFRDYNHMAALLTVAGERIVVDHTLRQFDPSAPHPAVMPYLDWVGEVERVGAEHYGAPATLIDLTRYA